MDAIFFRNLCRLVVLSAFLIFSSEVIGQQWVWNAADSAWVGKTGSDPWRLRGRTGLVSDSGRYYRTDFYVNDKIKGFLEYLPSGYNSNPNAKYPLIIYFPGCGEIHNGVMYLHGPAGNPNYFYGMGRFFAQGNPPPKDIRINAGGSSQKLNGDSWWAESITEYSTYLNAGTSTPYSSPGATVSGTLHPELYRTGRSGNAFSYVIPMNNGTYKLRLHFAELDPAIVNNQFTVTAEGAVILNNFNILSTAGANTAYVFETNVNIGNGALDLLFNAVGVNVAKVSAIEIRPVTSYNPGNGFPSIPTQLRDNGDYFSKVPLKTLGQKYSNGGPTQGVIVLSMMQYGLPTVCNAASSVLQDEDVQAALNIAFKKYRIDPTRVYLTGMSAGGGVSYTFPGLSLNNARTFAAVAPIAAVNTILNDATAASNIINGGTAVLAVTNYNDFNTNGTGANAFNNNKVAIQTLNAIAPIVPKQVTFYTFTDTWQEYDPTDPLQDPADFPKRNHNGWERAYRTENPNWDSRPAVFVDTPSANNYEKYTLYEWFLLNQNLASPLPVLLKTFTATRINNTVELDWVTSTEINSSYFTLERSVDGMNFSYFAKVDAAGNSVTEKKYKHVDNSLPGSPYVYYRLSQTDKDGKKQIFGIRKVFIGNNGFELRVFPTLTTGTLNIEVQGVSSDPMHIRIVDLSGKILMKQVIAPRQNRLAMDVSRLAKGMYILQADNSVHRFTTKFIKQ